jgi:hypothetical protein
MGPRSGSALTHGIELRLTESGRRDSTPFFLSRILQGICFTLCYQKTESYLTPSLRQPDGLTRPPRLSAATRRNLPVPRSSLHFESQTGLRDRLGTDCGGPWASPLGVGAPGGHLPAAEAQIITISVSMPILKYSQPVSLTVSTLSAISTRSADLCVRYIANSVFTTPKAC